MRTIDAHELIKELHNTTFFDGDDRTLVYKIIEAQPTVEPEIINCADCKFWVGGYIVKDDDFMPPHCWKRDGVWTHDDYCSYAVRAERRTDA